MIIRNPCSLQANSHNLAVKATIRSKIVGMKKKFINNKKRPMFRDDETSCFRTSAEHPLLCINKLYGVSTGEELMYVLRQNKFNSSDKVNVSEIQIELTEKNSLPLKKD